MYKMLKEKVLEQGHFQLNFERTMESENNVDKPTCLDMAFSTHKNKITSVKTHFPMFSDHAMIEVNRSSKRLESQKSYRKN